MSRSSRVRFRQFIIIIIIKIIIIIIIMKIIIIITIVGEFVWKAPAGLFVKLLYIDPWDLSFVAIPINRKGR